MSSNNQCQRVLDALRDQKRYRYNGRKGITFLQVIYFQPPILNLKGRIFDLRRMGHQIDSVWRTNPNTKTRHVEYVLVQEARFYICERAKECQDKMAHRICPHIKPHIRDTECISYEPCSGWPDKDGKGPRCVRLRGKKK